MPLFLCRLNPPRPSFAADPVKLRGDANFHYDVFAMPGAFARPGQ